MSFLYMTTPRFRWHNNIKHQVALTKQDLPHTMKAAIDYNNYIDTI